MSYRNPKQIIDTQSGQYIRDLQKSLADTYSGVASEQKKEYDRRAILNEKIVAKSQERVNKISGQVNQVANANKAINFDQMYDNLDTYNQYMQINPSKRTREMNLFISNMDNSGTNLKNNLANTLAVGEDFVEAREKGLGVPGGIYSAAKDLEKYEVMFGYNQAPGSKKMNYNPLTNEFRVNVIGKDGKSLGSSLNQDMEHLDIPQIVPDERKDMEEVAKMAASVMDLKNPNSPAYKGQPESGIPEGEGSNKFRKSRLPSREYYITQARPYAKAQVDSLTAGEAIALYNDYLRKEGADPIVYQKTWIKGSPETEALKKIITDAYTEHTADNQAKQILATGLKFGSVQFEETVTVPTPTNEGEVFYNKIKQNPISFLREFGEVKGTYDKDKNTISVPNKKEGEKNIVFNMNDPDSRTDFYTRLLRLSKFAQGGGDNAKLIRSQFSKALRADNSKKFATETEKKEFDEFAAEWDKNNLSPLNSSFRMKSIMDAYKESKK